MMWWLSRGKRKMPQNFLTLVTHFFPVSPKRHKYLKGSKQLSRLVVILLLFLSGISIHRLVKIVVVATSSPSPSPSPYTIYASRGQQHVKSNTSSTFTTKEFQLVYNLIKRKTPCNLLIFGFNTQYLTLSSINQAGKTVILEDDHAKISHLKINSNSFKIYKVKYREKAKEAYELLKIARKDPACAPRSTARIQESKCILALKNMPREVREIEWDVVIVDGPDGGNAEAPGRMSAIYTASMLARAGNTTHVLVHDVNRSIEKWFSWEFLCQENLAQSKGKLWEFRITTSAFSSGRFCFPQQFKHPYIM